MTLSLTTIDPASLDQINGGRDPLATFGLQQAVPRLKNPAYGNASRWEGAAFVADAMKAGANVNLGKVRPWLKRNGTPTSLARIGNIFDGLH